MEAGLFPTVETVFSEQPPSKCWNGFGRNWNDAKILVFHRYMKGACIYNSCGVTCWICHCVDNLVGPWYSVSSLVMRTSMKFDCVQPRDSKGVATQTVIITNGEYKFWGNHLCHCQCNTIPNPIESQSHGLIPGRVPSFPKTQNFTSRDGMAAEECAVKFKKVPYASITHNASSALSVRATAGTYRCIDVPMCRSVFAIFR